MAELNDELKRLDKFLNETVDLHEQRLLKSLSAMENKIVSLYARLSVDAEGNLKGPKWTLAQAQELHKKLVREFSQQYEKEVDWLSRDYRAIEREVQSFTSAMGVDEAFTAIDKKMLSALKRQDFAVYNTLSNQTVEKIAQGVYDAISAGQSFAALSHTIAAAITGYKDIAGRPLSNYAGTFAHDSLMKYYRNVHLTNADAAGLDHYLYYGDVIRDSRPFCVARAGKTYTKEQVDSWNGMAWAGKSGNVWACCGGYRCRHHLVAVKPEWVKGQADKKDNFAHINDKKIQALAEKSFNGSPKLTAALVDKYSGSLKNVNILPAGSNDTSFYMPSTKTISLRYAVVNNLDDTTFRHEFGHHVDFESGNTSWKQQFALSMDIAAKKTYKGGEAHDRLLKDVGSANSDFRHNNSVSDLVDALTKGRIRGDCYHRPSYYKKHPGRRPAQIFANLFDLYSENKAGWRFLNQVLPELCIDFEKIIGGLI